MECGALDVLPTMRNPYSSMLKKLLFGCIAFAVLSVMLLNRPAWKLNDFDQPFYVTIAYDLDKYGVFSNGPVAPVDSTIARPPPGMFFGPVYPALVLAAMKLAFEVRDLILGELGRTPPGTVPWNRLRGGVSGEPSASRRRTP